MDADHLPGRSPGLPIPPELVNILGTSGAIFAVVAAGAGVTALLPEPISPWLFAAAYAGPGGAAFAIYWWIARRL